MRADGRRPDQLRPVEILPHYLKHAEGSALIRQGETWVLCAASVEEKVPPFLIGRGLGWVTAEYGMLPRATHTRGSRQASGRSQEIQRLVGRALRMAVDTKKLGQRTITIDCDVIQADGGTRTASITGGYVALALALRTLRDRGLVAADPLVEAVQAVSVGVIDGEPRLDLPYEEDSHAEVDMNVVMTAGGRFVELQGTAEKAPFDQAALATLCELARKGCAELHRAQLAAIEAAAAGRQAG